MTKATHKRRTSLRGVEIQIPLFALLLLSSSCANVRRFMAIDESREETRPIENPFGSLYGVPQQNTMVVRSKKGERSLEFEIPTSGSETPEWEIPTDASKLSQERQVSRAPASAGAYSGRGPTVADREIMSRIPVSPAEQSVERREIEDEMGLYESSVEGASPTRSYLGRLDHVKLLYRESRFEAALLEVEEMLGELPMDPRLHEMRGTLLDRLGHADLARQSWSQALEIQPSNEPLRRYLEMRGVRAPVSISPGGQNP